MPGYRDPTSPEPPKGDSDRERYRRERDQWWDNWAHNFTLSLTLLLVGFLGVIATILILGVIATIVNG